MRRQILVLAAVLVFLYPAGLQAKIAYKVIDLGTFGDDSSSALSINDAGQIAGVVGGHATLFDPTGAGNNLDLGTGTAWSINDAGQIVGSAVNSAGRRNATLFDPTGTCNNIDLGTLGGLSSDACCINDSGQIVGSAYNNQWEYRATLFNPTGGGNNIDLGTVGGDDSWAYSINDAGQIVGWAVNSQGRSRATLFDSTGSGKNIDLGTLGGPESSACCINDAGQIVGWAVNSQGRSRATLFDPTGAGNNIDLCTFGGDESRAYSINETGQIVGVDCIWPDDTDGRLYFRSVLFDHTGAANNIDLNTLIDPASGWTLTIANDINNSGWIVGQGINPQGESHAFLLIPSYSKYSGGTGEPNDPYQISSAEDLIALGNEPNDYDKHFILTADIDLDPNLPGRRVFDKAVIAPDTDPNDDSGHFQGTPFTGVFDGSGHNISRPTIQGGSYLGVFGQLGALETGVEVKNLGVVDVNITGSGSCVAGLVGSNGGRLTRCHSSGAVRGNSAIGGLVGDNAAQIRGGGWGAVTQCYSAGEVKGKDAVGGLMGANCGTVSQCYSTAAVYGDDCVGGLVGDVYFGGRGGGLTQCYSTGEVSGGSHVGGLIGWNSHAVTQCYSTGAVIGEDSVGGLVGANLQGEDSGGWVTDSFWDVQTSGQTTSDGGTGKATAEMEDPNTFTAAGWDLVGQGDGPHDIWGEPAGGGYPILWWQLSPLVGLPGFSAGTGEPNDPYVVSTPEELNSIGHNPRLMRCHFILTENLDLTGFCFYPIGDPQNPYAGVLDGNGHAISHLTIKGAYWLGLFGVLGSAAEVRDLEVVDVNIAGTDGYVGGLVGSNGDPWRAGGTVINCYIDGSVTGRYCVGGLAGYNAGTVTQCFSTGLVSNTGLSSDSIGGLVGWNRGTVNCCHSTCAVSVTEYDSRFPHLNFGGLVGCNDDGGCLIASYSSGSVSGPGYVGGLVGINHGWVKQCHSSGAVSGSLSIGGLMGSSNGIVTQCYSTGAVSGSRFVGGLVGSNYSAPRQGYVTASFWDIHTSGQTDSAGGTGKTTAEMQTAKTFLDAGWDFMGETGNGTEDIWWILEGKDYPHLWWENIEQ